MRFLELRPMLEVLDLDKSIHFYEDMLGFTCVQRIDNEWARMVKDQVCLMLATRTSRNLNEAPKFTGSLYLYTDNVEDLWHRLKDSVEISYPLESFEYGMREFGILDPDGYLLQFGQEILYSQKG